MSVPIPIEKLLAAGNWRPDESATPGTDTPPPPPNDNSDSTFDIQAFVVRAISKLKIQASGPYPDARGNRIWRFDTCPWQPDYNGNASIIQETSGGQVRRLGFHCFCGD